jgi:hypothetical protein
LMASINSRALLESPPGAGAFIVTVAMGFSPLRGDRGDRGPVAMRPKSRAFA